VAEFLQQVVSGLATPEFQPFDSRNIDWWDKGVYSVPWGGLNRWAIEGWYADAATGDYVVVDVVFWERPSAAGFRCLRNKLPASSVYAQLYVYLPHNGGRAYYSYEGKVNIVADETDGKLHVVLNDNIVRAGSNIAFARVSANLAIPATDEPWW